jgi:tetratricopeptide (TPR) repeat protein
MSATQSGNTTSTMTEQNISLNRMTVLNLESSANRYEVVFAAIRDLTEECSEERAGLLKKLADALMADHAVSHSPEMIEEAIATYEQVLQLRPLGHELRAEAVSDLGDTLCVFCTHNGTDDARAHRSLNLLREAVQLRPSHHPLRDRSLHILARALAGIRVLQQSGDLSALTECIDLNREALQLRSDGHPERADSLNNLAVVLLIHFQEFGDPTSLEECIRVNRELLDLRTPGHPKRISTLNNLASALVALVSFQGGLSTLAEADSLFREALELRPLGHPLRFRTLDNLAGSLYTRYNLQALPSALAEAVTLEREALKPLPANHPERWKIMNNMATYLAVDFSCRHDMSTISEAISLLRQALRPPGSPNRHYSLHALASALLSQFDETNDTACLSEAVTLAREVLYLRPDGHILRPHSLHMLGDLLSRSEHQSWHEALALFREAAESCPAGDPLRFLLLSHMSKCFLDPSSPFFDLSMGISHLSEASSNDIFHVNQRLGQAVSNLRYVETAYTQSMKDAKLLTREHYSSRILALHAQTIDLLPRAANFGLDHKTRFQVIMGSDEIARNAAARALLLGQTSQAVALLEEGRGIFWSQTLRLRATGFDGIPDTDREKSAADVAHA